MIEETVYYKSPIGTLVLSASDHCLTAALFANSWKGNKIAEDEIMYIKPRSAVLQNCIDQLDEYFAGKRQEFDIAFKQEGTEFQKSVWSKLTGIPYGRTVSYKELSKQIGNLKAIRAVGTTNGNNSICIIVPCHRVIGSDGSLVGYGGDLWRKKWLLDHESKIKNGLQTLFND